jgi:hypothetical protein
MRPVLIVIDSPRFNLLSGIVERHKDIRVQTLISKPSVETLNHRNGVSISLSFIHNAMDGQDCDSSRRWC